ncbi:hypothetical protein BJ742DRAFT_865804, partial [Cladochytrium replicatum]
MQATELIYMGKSQIEAPKKTLLMLPRPKKKMSKRRENPNISAKLQSQARILEWYVQNHPEIKKLAAEQTRNEDKSQYTRSLKSSSDYEVEFLTDQLSPTILSDQRAEQSFSTDSSLDAQSMVTRSLKHQLIELSSSIVDELYHCDTFSSDLNTSGRPILPGLHQFIMSVMQRTRSSLSSLALALFYLTRLKQIHPFCRGSHGSGHRIMLAALIVASKYLYDDTFNNKAWSSVSSGLYSLDEVNQMEIELLYFLKYQLWVTESSWIDFLESLDRKVIAKRKFFADENFANLKVVGDDFVPSELFSIELAFQTPTEESGSNSEVIEHENTSDSQVKQPDSLFSGSEFARNE